MDPITPSLYLKELVDGIHKRYLKFCNHFDLKHVDNSRELVYSKAGITNHVTTSNVRLDTIVTTVHNT